VLFLLGHLSLRGTGPVAWLLMLAGVIGLGGYLAFYHGLESGHVGLVSATPLRRAAVSQRGRGVAWAAAQAPGCRQGR
jgi:hypothetical protein